MNAAAGNSSYTALQAAAEEGHLEVVGRLLADGADVNAAAGGDSYTALQQAARHGHLEMVDRLLAWGASVNVAGDGYVSLWGAARGGHLKVVERLLAKGADANVGIDDHHQTALEVAAEGGYLEVVDRLLTAGADNTGAKGAALEAAGLLRGSRHTSSDELSTTPSRSTTGRRSRRAVCPSPTLQPKEGFYVDSCPSS